MTPVDPVVRRFNSLNATIGTMVPAVAIAQDTLLRVVPLLSQMQRFLSQRPRGARGIFRMLHRTRGRIVGVNFIERSEDIPTWSLWLEAYGLEIGYSARQLRRLIFNEPPALRYRKECGWSQSDHERLRAAASLALELTVAVESGFETFVLRAEIHSLLDGCEVLDSEWEPEKVQVRRRRRSARRVTGESSDLVA